MPAPQRAHPRRRVLAQQRALVGQVLAGARPGASPQALVASWLSLTVAGAAASLAVEQAEQHRAWTAATGQPEHRDHGADEVVKVKSIATDEIKLNEALADLAKLADPLDSLPPEAKRVHFTFPACAKSRRTVLDLREVVRELAAP